MTPKTCGEFTRDDWQLVLARAATISRQPRGKGATVDDFVALPPVPRAQVDEFRQSTGLALPADFVDLVTKFAGGWNFYWNLNVDSSDTFLEPPASVGDFGGNGEVAFIGATFDVTLLRQYEAFQEDLRSRSIKDPETLQVLPALFPLHAWDGGGGDYTVLRLDQSPASVRFLSHEDGYRLADKRVLGVGFREFVVGWAKVGFPECQSHGQWVNPVTHQPDEAGSNAVRWRSWLASDATT